MRDFIKVNINDNVAVALTNLTAGSKIRIDGLHITLRENIEFGHKFALNAILKGCDAKKYGMPIGCAIRDIATGEWVHTHNIRTNLSDINDYKYQPNHNLNYPSDTDLRDTSNSSLSLSSSLFNRHDKKNYHSRIQDISDTSISIYRRKDGNVGIRNELWIIPTVGCVNGIAKTIQEKFISEIATEKKIDGVYVFPHTLGCSQLGDDLRYTRTILQNMVKHPNAGGVLVIGLGCENNQIGQFKETIGNVDSERVRYMRSQDVIDEIEQGLVYLRELYSVMQHDNRTDGKLSELKFGLECGGSDGFSGLTANPLLGCFSDFISSLGGVTVLTEVPEMFGAETLLMSRCKDKDIFNKLVKMINQFKQYFIEHNQPIYENPSPGNIAGGITTLEEKSLGCTQKSGSSVIVDVVAYGELITTQGVHLLNAPGNDPIATTALAAAGCQMVLFTTGRGTPYGGFVPTVKISTNTDLSKRKPHWIDINAGELIGNQSMHDMLINFIASIVDIANGELTCNEKNNYRELAIFKTGVTL